MPSPKLTPLDEADRAEFEAWLGEHADSLPAAVRAALEQHHALCDGLRGSRYRLSQVLVELRRALGIIAASEWRLSGDPLGPLSNGDRARPKSERAWSSMPSASRRCQCGIRNWPSVTAARSKRSGES